MQLEIKTTKTLVFALLNTIFLSVFGQNYSSCKIFQYEGNDSLSSLLVSEHDYNEKGQLITFYERGYKRYSSMPTIDATYFNFYKDTLLQVQKSVDFKGDSSKWVYFYGSDGRKTKYESYELEPKKGKTWNKKSETVFAYNTDAKLETEKIISFNPSSEIIKKYSYNDKKQISEMEIYDGKIKLSKIEYVYNEAESKIIYTSFAEDGQPIHLKKGLGYGHQIIGYHKLNTRGQQTEVTITDEKNNFIGKTVYIYNSNNKISKQIEYSDNIYHVDITHVYFYQ